MSLATAQAGVVTGSRAVLGANTQLTTEAPELKQGVWITPLTAGVYYIGIDASATLEGMAIEYVAATSDAGAIRTSIFIPINDPSRVYAYGVTSGKVGFMYV